MQKFLKIDGFHMGDQEFKAEHLSSFEPLIQTERSDEGSKGVGNHEGFLLAVGLEKKVKSKFSKIFDTVGSPPTATKTSKPIDWAAFPRYSGLLMCAERSLLKTVSLLGFVCPHRKLRWSRFG